MILNAIYDFDRSLQKIGERPNLLHYKINRTTQQDIANWMMSFLVEIANQSDNPAYTVKMMSEHIPSRLERGYYFDLDGGSRNSVYFFREFYAGVCLDKEILKLFWEKKWIGLDNNDDKEEILLRIKQRIYNTQLTNIDALELKELEAFVWLSMIGAFFASYQKIMSQGLQQVLKLHNNWYQGISELFVCKDPCLALFTYNSQSDTWTQTDTYLNPDFELFDGFMHEFMQAYDIDSKLWKNFLQYLLERRDPKKALHYLWIDSIIARNLKNENNYAFFYLLWNMIWADKEHRIVKKMSFKFSLSGLYQDLKKREAVLVEKFSRNEAIFAYMALDFFMNFLNIISWHNDLLSRSDEFMVNTKNHFTVIMWGLKNIIGKESSEKKRTKSDFRFLYSLKRFFSKESFFETMRNVLKVQVDDEAFQAKNNTIDVVIARKKHKDGVTSMLFGSWYMMDIYLCSKENFQALLEEQKRRKEEKKIEQLRREEERKKELEEQKRREEELEAITEFAEKVTDYEVIPELFSAEELYEALKKQIFGQDALLKHISEKIYAYLILKKSNDKPLTFFLVWPPGTWKTYLSEVLVKVLNQFYQKEDEQFNAQSEMATNYQDSATLSKLLGASAAYAGHGDKITFFEELLKKKNQIILFDEIEKGSPALYPFFLDFMNNGKFETNDGQYGIYMGDPNEISYLPKGEKVHQLKNCILIFASNAIISEEQVIELSEDKKFKSEQDVEKFGKSFIQQNRTLRTALQNWRGNKNAMMDRAFLDRLQFIYLFNNLSEKYLKNIVINKFEKLLRIFKISEDEKKKLNQKFKVGFMRSEQIKNMKDAHSMRELQAIIEDWIERSIREIRIKEIKK